MALLQLLLGRVVILLCHPLVFLLLLLGDLLPFLILIGVKFGLLLLVLLVQLRIACVWRSGFLRRRKFTNMAGCGGSCRISAMTRWRLVSAACLSAATAPPLKSPGRAVAA